ncbi:uncharacterized protein L201_001514 [Kwoniella dendrophila CBS 6074]|uniref:Uncharacterized protein n=1 Tax=Kwoniella dendrophila CBS 6074 TaxID=1295534 RepID=A0AAX4JP82_9TREE
MEWSSHVSKVEVYQTITEIYLYQLRDVQKNRSKRTRYPFPLNIFFKGEEKYYKEELDYIYKRIEDLSSEFRLTDYNFQQNIKPSLFGLDPLSIHYRKVYLLSKVTYLTIEDCTSGTKLCQALHALKNPNNLPTTSNGHNLYPADTFPFNNVKQLIIRSDYFGSSYLGSYEFDDQFQAIEILYNLVKEINPCTIDIEKYLRIPTCHSFSPKESVKRQWRLEEAIKALQDKWNRSKHQDLTTW